MQSSEPPHGGFSLQFAHYFVIPEYEGPYFGYDIAQFWHASEDAYRAIDKKITMPWLLAHYFSILQTYLLFTLCVVQARHYCHPSAFDTCKDYVWQ